MQEFVEVGVRANAAWGNVFLDFALRCTLTTPDGIVFDSGPAIAMGEKANRNGDGQTPATPG